MKILDLGCGKMKREGAIGVDRSPDSLADVIWDLNRLPWPFPDDEFDLIICRHVLEHLDDIVKVMEEIHRVGKDHARVEITTPHFSSVGSWDDPTHKHHFSTRSFDYFVAGAELPPYSARQFLRREARLDFRRGLLDLIPRFLCRFFRRHYERRFAFLFPAKNIYVCLEVAKGEGPAHTSR